MIKKYFFIFLAFLFFLPLVFAFRCTICEDPSDLVLQNANTTIIASVINLTLNFSRDIYYERLVVDPEGEWIGFDCFGFSKELNASYYNLFINSPKGVVSGSLSLSDLSKCNGTGSLIPNLSSDNHGATLSVWFPSWIYVVLLILAFILFLCLMYFGLYTFAGLLAILVGLIMLYSGIIWIISFPVLLGGIAILFIPESFSFRRKK